ncbi:fatty acyl-AMP ligase [Corallococcus llansteffanensis]|uniref:Fatty acyl-AMP ligase n=1 Tax=Corallococcus llansteffanensis TaxID=2316731 RepID=A0A3A8QYK3_9BACT|nr:fatty acyl-AMP ligase [Corallococcus llansteffanensis]RKH68214.1 fatty acyl-AMP ligase [Corallococcus llansteffanensis]
MALLLESPNLVALLRDRRALTPDHPLFTFLVDGEEAGSYTSADLDTWCRRVGAALQPTHPRGGRALLLFPPGLDFLAGFLGAMYGGLVAVPTYPPNPMRLQQTLPRFRAIVQDASPSVILTTSFLREMMESIIDQEAPELRRIPWVCIDALPEGSEDAWTDPKLDPWETAFIQYTSGSTGIPKGVVITHRNVIANGRLEVVAFTPFSGRPVNVSWLPMFHDMGLMFALHSMVVDAHFVFMSPLDFLQRPMRWLQALTKYRAEMTVAPNFAFELCLRRVDEKKRAELDLSNLRMLLNGAEPIRPHTLDRFNAFFAPVGLRPTAFLTCYGLAETTLMVSTQLRNTPFQEISVDAESMRLRKLVEVPAGTLQAQRVVGYGRSWVDRLLIVDPETREPLPPRAVGELWVQGAQVANGYWQRPEETQAAFGARLANGDGPFLRTGDMGCLDGEQLYLLGRLKELIIIRGRNLYPTDLEQVVEAAHPLVRRGCCAAFAMEENGEERLGIAFELERTQAEELPPEALRQQLAALVDTVRQAIAENFDVQAHTVAVLPTGGMPKTSSGKLRRRACNEGLRDGTLPVLG